VIDYCPAKSLLESKSLKLFLASFRNAAGFHEDCTVTIGKRIVAAIKPKYLRIAGFWYPARRHSHRCVLADGTLTQRRVAYRMWKWSLTAAAA
jgi:NADPH-dependent 7-cyano-7-deazaguanine reductase QueF